MKTPIFKGCATAIITPFDEDGGIDFDTLGINLDRQIESGVSAIVACGDTGEGQALSDMEYDMIIGFCSGRINGRVPLVASVGCNRARHCVELSQAAGRMGADALLAAAPYYSRTTQEGLAAYFCTIASATKLPILLYNAPPRMGTGFTAQTFAGLSEHPRIFGAVEASGDMALALETRQICPDDFCVYSGRDDTVVPVLSIGGAGVVSVISNIVPDIVNRMCKSWSGGEAASTAGLQIKCWPLISAVLSEQSPIALKAGLAMLGLDSGALRLPLAEAGEPVRERVGQALRGIGLLKE